MKNKLRTYSDKFCTNFSGVNVPEDGVECDSFRIISIHQLLVFMKADITYKYI